MTETGETRTPGTWPLHGRRILVTRAADQAPALSNALAAHGAETVVIPTIQIVAPASYAELDQAIAGLDETDYLVLTSVNAVDFFFNAADDADFEIQQFTARDIERLHLRSRRGP